MAPTSEKKKVSNENGNNDVEMKEANSSTDSAPKSQQEIDSLSIEGILD